TLRIVGETLLGLDVSSRGDAVRDALTDLLADADHRIANPFAIPRMVPTPANRRFERALDTVDSVVNEIITARRRSRDDGAHDSKAADPLVKRDLLDMLMDARDEETGEGMSDVQLRDEVMTIFAAGHETTANALVWTWYFLGR